MNEFVQKYYNEYVFLRRQLESKLYIPSEKQAIQWAFTELAEVLEAQLKTERQWERNKPEAEPDSIEYELTQFVHQLFLSCQSNFIFDVNIIVDIEDLEQLLNVQDFHENIGMLLSLYEELYCSKFGNCQSDFDNPLLITLIFFAINFCGKEQFVDNHELICYNLVEKYS